MSGIFASNGSLNVTVVSGATYTGVYAADGSINVIKSPGGVYVGAYHPCGAWYVTVSPGGILPIRAPDGSLYVQQTPGTLGSGQTVTVISGNLFGSGSGSFFPLFW